MNPLQIQTEDCEAATLPQESLSQFISQALVEGSFYNLVAKEQDAWQPSRLRHQHGSKCVSFEHFKPALCSFMTCVSVFLCALRESWRMAAL